MGVSSKPSVLPHGTQNIFGKLQICITRKRTRGGQTDNCCLIQEQPSSIKRQQQKINYAKNTDTPFLWNINEPVRQVQHLYKYSWLFAFRSFFQIYLQIIQTLILRKWDYQFSRYIDTMVLGKRGGFLTEIRWAQTYKLVMDIWHNIKVSLIAKDESEKKT